MLCARTGAGAIQQYAQCLADRDPALGPLTYDERITWQWYATGGTFVDAGGVGNATGGDLEFERPAGAFTMWVILRDGRGGEAWVERSFEAP